MGVNDAAEMLREAQKECVRLEHELEAAKATISRLEQESVGFVVVEFNQASGQPDILDHSFDTERHWADERMDRERKQTALYGRRERYAIGLVLLTEEPA